MAILELVVVVWSRLRVLDALVVDISDTLSRPGLRTMFNAAHSSAAHHSSLLATRSAVHIISHYRFHHMISLFDNGFVLVVLVLY